MEKMEFIYTSGWEKFEQYCKELYRGYLNRYCQGNEKACEDEINKAYAMGMNFIREKVKENKEILKQLWVAAFIGNLARKYDLTVTVRTQSCVFIIYCFQIKACDMMNKRRFTMYTKQPKKMIIINILDILKRYTDENHRLSQREIMDILEREYDMKVDRKAVKRNLMNLIDFGYQVEYSESIRQGKNGEEEIIFTDWYLEKDFTDSELRLLIDSLLFSKHIPYSQCKALIEKLEGLSNCYFKSRVKHIQTMPDTEPQNKQLFYTIEMLDKAITKGRQVAFYYNEYHTDMKMYPRENEKGEKRRYIINPYQIAAINGRYYLICNYDKYDNVANYRLDRITDIEILPVPVKPMKKVKGLENGLNLPKHMAEHIYMFTGESAAVTFRAKKYLVSEIIDWFGKDIKFSDETEDEVTVRVMVNLEAMRKWALQYAVHVKILSPGKLVDMVKEDIKKASEQYKGEH